MAGKQLRWKKITSGGRVILSYAKHQGATYTVRKNRNRQSRPWYVIKLSRGSELGFFNTEEEARLACELDVFPALQVLGSVGEVPDEPSDT